MRNAKILKAARLGVGLMLAGSLASVANAECVGNGTNTCTIATDDYIQESFTFRPSKDVTTAHASSATVIAVASKSAKGTTDRVFAGNSDGGAIAVCGGLTVPTSITVTTTCAGGS